MRAIKKIRMLTKAMLVVAVIIWVISAGGLYAGKMVGILIIMLILVVYFVIQDARRYKRANNTWLEAMGESTIENIKFILK